MLSKCKAFTLVEMLVALAVSSIIIIASYASYDLVATQYRKNLDIADMHTSGRAIMRIIERDIRMAGFEYRDKDAKVTYGTISSPLNIKDSGNKCCDEVTVIYDYFDEESKKAERIRIRYWAETHTSNKGSRYRLYKQKDILGQNKKILAKPKLGTKEVMADYIEDLQFNDATSTGKEDSAGCPAIKSMSAAALTAKKILVDIMLSQKQYFNKNIKHGKNRWFYTQECFHKIGGRLQMGGKCPKTDASTLINEKLFNKQNNYLKCYGSGSGGASDFNISIIERIYKRRNPNDRWLYSGTEGFYPRIYMTDKLSKKLGCNGSISPGGKCYAGFNMGFESFENKNYQINGNNGAGNYWMSKLNRKYNSKGYPGNKAGCPTCFSDWVSDKSALPKVSSGSITQPTLIGIHLTLRTKNQYGKDKQFKKKDYHAGNYKLDKTDKYKRDTFSSTVSVRNLAL